MAPYRPCFLLYYTTSQVTHTKCEFILQEPDMIPFEIQVLFCHKNQNLKVLHCIYVCVGYNCANIGIQ